jgi:nucleoside phosphorylase
MFYRGGPKKSPPREQHKMRILVTFAVEAEFAPWRKLRKFRKLSAPGKSAREFVSTIENDAGHEIVVLLTGIGETTSLETLNSSTFSDAAKPDVLISSGFAGGLRAELLPGTIVAPAKKRTLKNHANVDSDAALRDEAIRLGAVPIENLITLDRLAKTVEDKAHLAFFGEAVDMESAVVMSHFATASVPALALRVVSDAADEDLPLDFDRCLTPQGAIKPMNLVNQIVKQPNNLPNIVRFGRQSHQAGRTLAAFLERFVLAVPVLLERFAKA